MTTPSRRWRRRVAEADREFFEARGFGQRIGFGEQPAVIVIDFMNAFTDPSMPLGAKLDAEGARRDLTLYASVDSVERHFEASRCTRP